MRKFNPKSVPIPQNIPTETTSFINQSISLNIEIGCGVGMHPLLYSTQSDTPLIAIERTKEKFRKFKNSFIKAGAPEHILPIHADAINFFVHFIQDNSVDKIFILYPNPYPKEKQANQRFHHMPFMEKIYSSLKCDGELLLVTNIQSYAQEAKDNFTGNWGFKIKYSKTLKDGDIIPRTHFEKKYLEDKQTCYETLFYK